MIQIHWNYVCLFPVSRKTTSWNCELLGTTVQLDKDLRCPGKSQLRNTVGGPTWHFITQVSFVFWCYLSHSVAQ